MRIKKFIMDCLDSNSYLVYGSEECYIVDIGGENISQLTSFIDENGLKPKGIFLTHGHIDHIAGINKVLKAYPEIKLYISENEIEFLHNKLLNLAFHFPNYGFEFQGEENVVTVTDGELIESKFEIMTTPGHTAGSISIYYEEGNIVFTGDTMFRNSIGRTDLPTGNYREIWKSLKKLVRLPENTAILPGHGEESDIKSERKSLFEGEDYI